MAITYGLRKKKEMWLNCFFQNNWIELVVEVIIVIHETNQRGRSRAGMKK